MDVVDPPETKTVNASPGVTFTVPKYLEFVKKLGSGAYGMVSSFVDTRTGEKVAVKKVSDAFQDLVDAKRILREIKILRHCHHPNIVQILDLHAPPELDFKDIYIVMELMESDLNSVIKSKQKLTEEHIKHFTFQILRGLRYLHSAGVIHRDLKPMNILVNKDGEVKVCDLGLSRGLSYTDEEEETTGLTDYVVTRWYRAPEVVLSAGEYTRQIDTWAAGCILGEMYGRKPLFRGADYIDQVRKIIEVLGTPVGSDIDWLPKNGPARKFLGKVEAAKKKPWKEVYPAATPQALELVAGLLEFNPNKRLTTDDALKHKFFAELEYDEDTLAEHKIDWNFDHFEPKDRKQIQNFIYCESAAFHPGLLKRDEAMLKSRGITESMLLAAGIEGNGDVKPFLKESFSATCKVTGTRPGLNLESEQEDNTTQQKKKKQSCCSIM